MSEQRYDPDVLARRLDQALPAHKKFLPPVTPDPLVNTATEIAKLGIPILSPQASSRIEAQLLAAFDEQYRPRIVPRSPVTRSPKRTRSLFQLALVASLAIVVLLMGLSPAVAASLPGEPLYRVKQLYETVELSAATTSAAKANVYIQHANRRAQEALALLEKNQFDPTIVSSALSNIADAEKSSDDVRASAQLRGQVAQVDTTLKFVLQNAQESGLTSINDVAPLSQQVTQIESSDLLLALPSSEPDTSVTATPTPTATPSPTDELTETPSPEPTLLGEGDGTATCEHGQSCLSQGVPGGQVATPTRRPTNVHRNPTPTPQTDPGGGNGNNGDNGNNDNGNNGGSSNGGGNSAGGSSNGNGGSGGGGGGGNGKGGG